MDPGESTDDPHIGTHIGTHYRDMLKAITEASQLLRNNNLHPQLKGVVWMPGEQDSKHKISANAHAASVRRLKQWIEQDLSNDPSQPVFVPLVMDQVLRKEHIHVGHHVIKPR